MENFATIALVLLGIIWFNNYRDGRGADWLKAKFLNAAAPRPSGSTTTTAALLGTSPARSDVVLTGLGGGSGVLQAPVSGGVLSSIFGAPRPGGRTHSGIDYAVGIGTPVRAARAGRVTWAGSSSGYGLRIDLDHGDGVSTRYAHLSRIDVRVGQAVPAGATIGLSGNTGESTGPHLHFELREGGRPVDPTRRLPTAAVA